MMGGKKSFVNYKEAINASQIWAARGFDSNGACVVSVCFYDNRLMWLEGWGGNWSKTWSDVPEEKKSTLDILTFLPTGPKSEDQLASEILSIVGGDTAGGGSMDDETRLALEAIADEYELEDELGDDYFTPIGDAFD